MEKWLGFLLLVDSDSYPPGFSANFALCPEQQKALAWILIQEGGICFSEREFVVVVDSNIVVVIDSNIVVIADSNVVVVVNSNIVVDPSYIGRISRRRRRASQLLQNTENTYLVLFIQLSFEEYLFCLDNNTTPRIQNKTALQGGST
jgi:hypothetical protein